MGNKKSLICGKKSFVSLFLAKLTTFRYSLGIVTFRQGRDLIVAVISSTTLDFTLQLGQSSKILKKPAKKRTRCLRILPNAVFVESNFFSRLPNWQKLCFSI